jgi:hypothetical protein
VSAIIHEPTAEKEVVRTNASLMGASELFLDTMFDELWNAAAGYGINPVGMIAQSFKETGGGKYPGRVKDWFYNTAGIKVRHDGNVMVLLGTEDSNTPLVHQMFPNWKVGAVAHAQRLLDYCGLEVEGLIVDPRHGFGNRGITTWEELGGRWAPSSTYGVEIVDLMGRLSA